LGSAETEPQRRLGRPLSTIEALRTSKCMHERLNEKIFFYLAKRGEMMKLALSIVPSSINIALPCCYRPYKSLLLVFVCKGFGPMASFTPPFALQYVTALMTTPISINISSLYHLKTLHPATSLASLMLCRGAIDPDIYLSSKADVVARQAQTCCCAVLTFRCIHETRSMGE
jgi:hypothetical protein